ncbi:hypothetical protein BpHYR1_004358 [Brachionus plicatilis]|uniref:Uncharacterized protein n=1 Tax=Brachionus plicatilis TaxID=10195 RepID=A0A3M7RKM7_BRAPC|nr:hypothetical protein BpHYR1_004358 [Brachionus plicatilis]
MNENSRSRSEPILTNISLSVDNQFIAPPSYDFVIKHTYIVQSENQPPSYESLYERIQNAHRTLGDTVQNNSLSHYDGTKKLSSILGPIFIFGFFLFLPILQIAVGTKYKNECPANNSIPFWLIIQGIFIIFLDISIVFFKYYDCSMIPNCGILMFLVSWLIRGSIWVYGYRGDFSFDPQENSYCNRNCFSVAFWSITIKLILY